MSKLRDYIKRKLATEESENDLVVVASYDSSALAYIDKGVLENNDIQAWVDDDMLMRYVPMASPGIALRVLRKDLDKAQKILNPAESDYRSDS